MATSPTDVLFILLIGAMMAAPPAALAYLVWRKVLRRIDRLEEELDELREDMPEGRLREPSPPRLRDENE
jgi:HAMP domain-containing protein